MKSIATSLAGTALALTALHVSASSHREAPFITQMPTVDATDFYMFRSYETGRDGYVTLIANYNPLQDAYGGPNYFALNPRALYEIHVDNNGDAVEDLSFQFRFAQRLGNDGAGAALSINGSQVAVPLKFIGPVNGPDSASLNFFETYELSMVSGDRRSGQRTAVSNAASGATTFAKPLDNVGEKTFSQTPYADYAAQFVYDVNLAACPAGARDGRVFVGQRAEPFAVNLGEVFDLVNTNPLGPVDGEANIIANKNITTLALEVPIDCLKGSSGDVVGAWTTASLPQVQVLDPTPTFDQPGVDGGAWTQVSRLSMPLVNEVVIGLPDKDRFNASEPADDAANFLTYVTNPTLPALLEVLFGVRAPTVEGRPDLVAAFLTGFTGVNANGSAAEMQRLNMAIAPTAAAEQNNLGVAAGDNAGFPNGRRPGDDVVDAALRVSMGLLCHLGLGLCDPEDAPDGLLPYTDGALQNAAQFDAAFPYLKTPTPGALN